MNINRALIAALAIAPCVLGAGNAEAALTLSPDGKTVYDSTNNIVWLASGDLAATNRFGLNNCQTENVPNSLPCVNTNGSMSYQSALKWVQDMNNSDYEGHNNWQLPISPNTDMSCSSTGPMPAQNSFGFYCANNALGSLYKSLGLAAPDPVSPQITDNVSVAHSSPGNAGSFLNLQPGLYWSSTNNTNNSLVKNGYNSFSFETGFEGSQVGDNFHFVLPMIVGQLPPGTPANILAQTVYDPVANVTWLADANYAAQNPFSLQSCQTLIMNSPGLNLKNPVDCINSNGSMNHESALQWIADLKQSNYLGQSDWELPPVLTSDANCTVPDNSGPAHPSADQIAGYNCTGGTPPAVGVDANVAANPFGSLFYNVLDLTQGVDVIGGPISDTVGPFTDFQPYQYWSCEGEIINSACSGTPAAPGFQFSYMMGDGYQDTDIVGNDLFVTAYYNVPEPMTFSLFGIGLAGVIAMRRRKKRPA